MEYFIHMTFRVILVSNGQREAERLTTGLAYYNANIETKNHATNLYISIQINRGDNCRLNDAAQQMELDFREFAVIIAPI